jgi:hypothetical protein
VRILYFPIIPTSRQVGSFLIYKMRKIHSFDKNERTIEGRKSPQELIDQKNNYA